MLRRKQFASLLLGLSLVLGGCAVQSDKDSQHGEGLFPALSAEARACFEKWNDPQNSGRRSWTAMGAFGAAERSYASFMPSDDFPGECEVVIASPEFNQATLLRTGGAVNSGLLYGSSGSTLEGTVDEVAPEKLEWNALVNPDGSMVPSEDFNGSAFRPSLGSCFARWNDDGNYSGQSTVATISLGGEGRGTASPDTQFPDQCLVVVGSPSSSLVSVFRSGGPLGIDSWTLLRQDAVDAFDPEYTTWTARLSSTGTLEPLDAEVAQEAELGADRSSDETKADAGEYPKYFPEGSGCGKIGIEPNTSSGLFEIQVENDTCSEAIGDLLEWIRNGARTYAESPEGWSCSTTESKDAMPATNYTCEQGDKRLSFVAP